VSLGLVVLLLLSVAWSPLAEEYLLTVKAPPLERAFGFRARYVAVAPPAGAPEKQWRIFTLTDVTPGGRFEAAGFKAGDWLCVGLCRFYGDYVAPEAFLGEVERVQHGETLRFAITRGEQREIHWVVLEGRGASHNNQMQLTSPRR
jgi:hypothetical protein